MYIFLHIVVNYDLFNLIGGGNPMYFTKIYQKRKSHTTYVKNYDIIFVNNSSYLLIFE
jgi:hypothetical protein